MKWTLDRDADLAIGSQLEEQLSRNEIDFLESSGVRGTLSITRSSRTGKGPEARFVLIMHRQVQETVRFPLPDKTSVVYLQKEDSWLKFPPDAPEIDRELEIFPFLRFANDTQFFVELAPGGRTGGSLFRWDRDEVEEGN